MTEAVATEAQEATQEAPRPVFIYDEYTHGSTRLHEVVGTSPHSGDPQLRPLNLPAPADLGTTIQVPQPSGVREYEFVNLQGKDLDQALGRLEASGVVLKEKPLFVKLVLPNR